MKFDIKHRWTDRILYSGEGETLATVVESAVSARANLDGADLVGASLVGASLVGASLVGADLVGANLARANLVGASLDGAGLVGANLDGADLARANLDGASLVEVKVDLYNVLSAALPEVPALLTALREGRVDGSTYSGECACLVGTIANVRGCETYALDGIVPNASRPAERWFLGIHKGSTPTTNPIAKITEGWIEEFMLSNKEEIKCSP